MRTKLTLVCLGITCTARWSSHTPALGSFDFYERLLNKILDSPCACQGRCVDLYVCNAFYLTGKWREGPRGSAWEETMKRQEREKKEKYVLNGWCCHGVCVSFLFYLPPSQRGSVFKSLNSVTLYIYYPAPSIPYARIELALEWNREFFMGILWAGLNKLISTSKQGTRWYYLQ